MYMTKFFCMAALCFSLASIDAQAVTVIKADSVKVIRMAKVSPSRRMADKLMLDDKTSAKFMTLYEAYRSELRDAGDRQPGRKRKPENMTDEEISKQMEQDFETQQKKLDIRKKYYKKFSAILTPRQTYELFHKDNVNIRMYPFPGRKPDIRIYRSGLKGIDGKNKEKTISQIVSDYLPTEADNVVVEE